MNQQYQIFQLKSKVESNEIRFDEKLINLESQIQELTLQQNKHKVLTNI